MARTPTSADFERSVPQATAGVATYRPAADGGEAAESLYQQGRQTQELAVAIDRFGEGLDHTAAQDALNRLRERKTELTYDPEKGFMRIKGGDVLKNGPGGKPWMVEMPDAFKAASDEIGGKLLSPRARALYNEAASREMTSYKQSMAVHMAGESEKYEAAVYKDTNAIILREAVSAGTDPAKINPLIDRAEVAARNRAAQLGIPAESLVVAARSNTIRATIESQIVSGNGQAALSLFRLYGKGLDGEDRLKVGAQLKTVQAGEIARGYVADLNVDEGSRRDHVIKGFVAANYTPEEGAAWAANFYHESRFRTGTAVNKGDGADGSDSINMGQWNGPRARAFKAYALKNGLDENDPNTAIKYAQAEMDGEIPASVSGLSAGVRERFKAAKTVEEKAAILSKEFFKPRDTEGEARSRGQTAAKFLADFGKSGGDALAKSVNAQTPEGQKAEGPAGFLDTRKQMIAAEEWYLNATRRNAADWANDPTQMSANQHLIDVQFQRRKQEIQLNKDRLNNAVQDWVTKPDASGMPQTKRPPPEIWNQLSFEQQRSIDATLAHNAKGTDAITDQATWYEIQRGLTSPDPAERARWAGEPLWKYKDKLSNNDFQELAKMQGAVRKGDPDKELSHVGSVNQMVDRTLTTLGIDPTPKPSTSPTSDAGRSAAFRRAVQDDLTAFEKQKGSKATPEEMQKIIDRLTREVAGTGGWLSKSKRVFEMKIGDVPKEERAKIEDALKRNGKPITDQAIIDLYSRKAAK